MAVGVGGNAPHLAARPTIYKGVKMRSRLEASFAQYLDSVGLAWDYEPECFADETGQYLPDFLIGSGDLTCYIEVKHSNADHTEAMKVMHRILSSRPTAALGVVSTNGVWPDLRFQYVRECDEGKPCGMCARVVPIQPRSLADHVKDAPFAPTTDLACIGCGATMLHLHDIDRDNESINITYDCENCPTLSVIHLHQHKGTTECWVAQAS